MERKQILGWAGAAAATAISCVWAYWGAFENFHEGWYSTSLWENLFMFFFQYLLFAFVFTLLGLLSLVWKKTGLALHLLAAGFCLYFFSGASFSVLGVLIVLPLAGLGLLHYFGEPRPRRWARRLMILAPLAVALAISIPQGIKVSQRTDDGYLGARTVEGNGVTLVWAPRGAGWPDRGVSWEEAREICSHLSEDGLEVLETEQNIWRLPTAEEAVASMALHGENAGGVWDQQDEKAVYEKTPDKESPLWDVHSKVIYYWTADTCAHDGTRACIIVYNGGVYGRNKTSSQAYLSFRAVRDSKPAQQGQ